MGSILDDLAEAALAAVRAGGGHAPGMPGAGTPADQFLAVVSAFACRGFAYELDPAGVRVGPFGRELYDDILAHIGIADGVESFHSRLAALEYRCTQAGRHMPDERCACTDILDFQDAAILVMRKHRLRHLICTNFSVNGIVDAGAQTIEACREIVELHREQTACRWCAH